MLKPGRLVQFILAKASGNQWKGDRDAGELFEMWSKLKDHVRSETEPEAEIDKESEPQPGPSTSLNFADVWTYHTDRDTNALFSTDFPKQGFTQKDMKDLFDSFQTPNLVSLGYSLSYKTKTGSVGLTSLPAALKIVIPNILITVKNRKFNLNLYNCIW